MASISLWFDVWSHCARWIMGANVSTRYPGNETLWTTAENCAQCDCLDYSNWILKKSSLEILFSHANGHVVPIILFLTPCCSPFLTWRDVQHIIVKTSRAGHLSAPDWKTNAAGYNGNSLFKLFLTGPEILLIFIVLSLLFFFQSRVGQNTKILYQDMSNFISR